MPSSNPSELLARLQRYPDFQAKFDALLDVVENASGDATKAEWDSGPFKPGPSASINSLNPTAMPAPIWLVRKKSFIKIAAKGPRLSVFIPRSG